MIIHIEEYNKVTNGLRTQLDIMSQELADRDYTIATLRELREGDFKEALTLKAQIVELISRLQAKKVLSRK